MNWTRNPLDSRLNLAAEKSLEPNLTDKAMKLSPVVALVSFFVWSWLFGSSGAILSMPITVNIMMVTKQDE